MNSGAENRAICTVPDLQMIFFSVAMRSGSSILVQIMQLLSCFDRGGLLDEIGEEQGHVAIQ